VDTDSSTTDFDMQARLDDWGTSVTTADWLSVWTGKTLLCHKATAGISAPAAYDFVDDALAANVSKTGTTRMILVSSRTVSATEPAGAEYVNLRSADYSGTTSDPRLTVTYTAGGGASTPVSLDAAQGFSAVFTRTVGKGMPVAETMTAASAWGIAKPLAATPALAAAVQRGSLYTVLLGATATVTASMTKRAGIALYGVSSFSAGAVKQVAKAMLVQSALAPSMADG